MKAIICIASLSLLAFSPVQQAFSKEPPEKVVIPHQEVPLKKINLNQANAAQLIHAVPGIGKKRAEAIVAFRSEHGQFKFIEELAQVRGLGQGFVAQHLAQLKAVFSIT